MKTRISTLLVVALTATLALTTGLELTTARAADITPEEARAIAKEAYTYGYPMVDSYRILNAHFVNRENPEYNTSLNKS